MDYLNDYFNTNMILLPNYKIFFENVFLYYLFKNIDISIEIYKNTHLYIDTNILFEKYKTFCNKYFTLYDFNFDPIKYLNQKTYLNLINKQNKKKIKSELKQLLKETINILGYKTKYIFFMNF